MEPRGINGVARHDPDRVALIAGDRRITFGELDADANRVAQALTGAGVTAGDRVAVMMQNRPEIFAVWNGVARVGGLVVPVSYRSLTSEVAYLVADSGATALVHDDTAVVGPALPELTGLLGSWHADDESLWTAAATPPTDDFLGAMVVTMNYTSGTTGRPKGIQRAAPQPAAEYPPNPLAAFWGFVPFDVHLLCGPAYHTAPGAYAQMSLCEGGSVVVMPRFTAESCLELIQGEAVTTSHMVPANFIRILEATWEDYDLTSVKKILHAAAPCPPAVKRRIMEVFPPGTVWEYYGASEGMCTVISPEEWLRKPGSVGRAFPGLEITIRDDDGNALPPGEVGSVYASGMPGMAKFAYHNAPEKTADAWRGDEFTVRDLGSLDEDGYLFLADRRVDLILRGGVNIYPAEVEHALATLPDVVDSAVFGLPDEQLGQRVHAIVELRGGAAPDRDSILAQLDGQLAPYKLPATIEFIDELPREPNGKVLKRQLRDARLDATWEDSDMVDTCRAAVFLGDHTYEIREFAVPDPPPGGALLRVEAVGLCGSDVAQFEGIEIVPGATAFPVVPGHETVGRVMKLAPDAALGVAEGDRVAVNEILMAPGALRLYGYSDMTGEGNVGLWGGYGEYMEIFPGTELHPMSDRLPAEQLTLFEPLASAVHWVETVGVHEGETVVVQGPGHQGLAVLEAVLVQKPRQVIVTGTSDDGLRLDAAKEIGASAVVMVDTTDAVALVRDLTRGMGADVVFDVATATQTVPMALDLARSGGRILLAGLKHFAEIPGLVSDHIVLKSLQLYGGAGFTPRSMAAAVAPIESGAVRTDVVAGEVFDLDGIDDAMALLQRTAPGRDAVRVGLRHSH